MGEEQRDCTLYIALLVHEVYIQRFKSLHLYSRLEIWQLVELSFLLSPIEFLPPISTQSFHVSQRGAIIPLGLVKLVGEGCGFKFLDKSLALFLRDGDGVGFNCCHDTIESRNKRTACAEACERKLIMAEGALRTYLMLLQDTTLLSMRAGHYLTLPYLDACPSFL